MSGRRPKPRDVSKNEHISVKGMTEATANIVQGVQAQRISGKPYVDTIPETPPEVKGKSAGAGENQTISEKSRDSNVDQALSRVSSEISTSLNSMKLQLKNKLGTISARLKKVEQGRTDSVKDPKSVQATRAGTINLWQEVQAPSSC